MPGAPSCERDCHVRPRGQEKADTDRASIRQARRRSARRPGRPPALGPQESRRQGAARPQRPARAAPLHARRAPLLALRARHLGRHRARRARRLRREPASADRSTGGAEAPAEHRHPRRRRLAPRQPGRHRRAGCEAHRPAALSAESLRRDRGPALLFAFRHRSGRHFAGDPARRDGRARRRGRVDADPAARQEPLPHPGADAFAQDPGGDSRAVARAQVLQGPDSRALSQPRLFRLGRVRGRGGGAEIFRQERALRHAAGGGAARGTDEVADQARAQPQSRRRQRARRAGHHRHGRAGPHH